MLLLSFALANPAVVKVSKKGMEAKTIAHGVMLPPSKDRVMVVLPLQVLYGVKPGKESTLVTGKSSDPAWVTFRDGRYLTVGDQQVRVVEDMVAELRYERSQVLLAFPSRLIREITAELPRIEAAGALPLPGASVTIPGVGEGTVERTWQEGYLRVDAACPVAGDPVLDAFGRMVGMTLLNDGGCVATLLPEVRYPTVRAEYEAALELWEVPISDWPTVLGAMLEGLPPAVAEPIWPAPLDPGQDSLLYSKAVAHAGQEELSLEEDQAKAWSKTRKKAQKKHPHPEWF